MKSFKGGLFGCLGVGAAIILVIIVLVAIGSAAGKSTLSPGATRGTASATAAAKHPIGSTLTAQDGFNVTVYSFQLFASTNEFAKPGPGHVFDSADVKECAGDSATAANPFDFILQMPDDSRIQPSAGWKDPALNSADLAPHACVRGWVTFELPANVTPKAILFNGSDQSAQWDF